MKHKKIPAKLLLNPLCFFALGCGIGLTPKAPGTAAAVLGMVIYYFFLSNLPLRAYVAVILISFFIGIAICRYTSNKIESADHPSIGFDEVVGVWIAMIAVPPNIAWVIIGFALFRVFDIYKPYPIAYIDKYLDGGLGIMLDDLMAGIYTCIVLHTIIFSYDQLIQLIA